MKLSSQVMATCQKKKRKEGKESSDIKKSIIALKVRAYHSQNTTKYFACALPLVQWFTLEWDMENSVMLRLCCVQLRDSEDHSSQLYFISFSGLYHRPHIWPKMLDFCHYRL